MGTFFDSTDFPRIHGVEWFNLFILIFSPLLACYGFAYVPIHPYTISCAFVYYLISMIGELSWLPGNGSVFELTPFVSGITAGNNIPSTYPASF